MAGLSQVRELTRSAHIGELRDRALGRRGHLATETSVPTSTTLTNAAVPTSPETTGSITTSAGTSVTPAATATPVVATTALSTTTSTPMGVWSSGGGLGLQGFTLGGGLGGGGLGEGGIGGGGLGGIGSLGGLIGQALSGPAPKAPTQGTSGTTTAPTQLQTDLQKLQTDLQAINDKSQVTPALLAAVRNDVQKIQSEATTAPDSTKLTTLENDVKAVNGQLPTDAQKSQLESDFTAVVQSEGVTDSSLISQTVSDIEAVVTATNVTATDLSTIAADQKAIQTDLGAATGATAATGQTAGADFLAGLTGGNLAGTSVQGAVGTLAGGPITGINPGGPMITVSRSGNGMFARGGGGFGGFAGGGFSI
jgi:hypothetical protein